MNAREERQVKIALDALGRMDVDTAIATLRSLAPKIERTAKPRPFRNRMPTREAIFKAQKYLVNSLGVGDGECWHCRVKRRLERAHIVPAKQGGGESPTNFFLLCGECHILQPDGMPILEQLEWVRRGFRGESLAEIYNALSCDSLLDLIKLARLVYGDRQAQSVLCSSMREGRSAAAGAGNVLANQAHFLLARRNSMLHAKEALDQIEQARRI